ncbi:MAG: 30S ribosomal protein S3 [Candidatus Komeilibacteria bacterium]
MGQKVNPKALRLGITQTWTSKWFARKDFAAFLQQDIKIRKYLLNKLRESGIDKIEISRNGKELTLDITAAKPGLIIGRGGMGIEEIKKDLQDNVLPNKAIVKINIKEVKDPNLSAAVVLQNMAFDLEKRIPFRRIGKQAIDKVMQAGAEGVKIAMAGRLNGAEIARTEMFTEGKIPLHTLRADIDYSRGHAQTTYGKIGLKVWIYKGEIFNKDKESEEK